MRKAGVALLAVLFSLAVGVGVSAKKTELVIWDWYKDRTDVLKPKIAEYEKLNPQVKITTSQVTWEEYSDKVLASVIGGTPPDIIQFHNSWTGRLLNMLAPFPPDQFNMSKMADQYYQFNTAFRMKDGKFYFFPDGLMTSLIFYNKRLFSQAGIGAAPGTWDELRATARKLTRKDAAGQMTVGGFGFDVALLFDDMNYQAGGGTYNDNRTAVTWYTDEGRKAITEAGAMAVTDGIRPTLDGFISNKTGMQYTWTHYKSNIIKVPAAKLEWGTFPLPTFNGRATDMRARNNYECGYAVPANVKSAKKVEAFRFLKWLYSDDNWYVKLNDVMGRLPGKKDLWTRPEITKDPVHTSLAKQIPYTVFPGERPAWIDTILNKMANNILKQTYSPIESLKRAQDDANRQWKIQPPMWIVETRLKR